MMTSDFQYDAVVVGAGHAGIEAGLALSRTGLKTLMLSITLDNVGYLACNPSIGGTAKGHLVREIDALGGEMGVAADKNLTQLKMLNSSKGEAVRSLRGQIDKYKYHAYMKQILESEKNLTLRQGEVKRILTEGGKVTGVETVTKLIYEASAVILCTGVYLDSTIIVGDVIEERGPACFSRSNYLADALKNLGFDIRRFKTGTPARVKQSSVDLAAFEVQRGELTPYTFSALTKSAAYDKSPCYLGYTNPETHRIIEENLHLSPKYSGLISGVGARYCPSIEDKIVRFRDKERHQFFLEHEGAGTEEMYVQGLSSGLPASVQQKIYRSVKGFEKVEIMRDAYAIEYECLNPLELYPTLMSKKVEGLYFAGQINGTSGYEEAGAQGIAAGINASLRLRKMEEVIFTRDTSYIGVLIDDLVTKGTNEPYRMMTSRAEYRLSLRQDNADLRLTEIGRYAGLVKGRRYAIYRKKLQDTEKARELLETVLPPSSANKILSAAGEECVLGGVAVKDLFKRANVGLKEFNAHSALFEGLNVGAVTEAVVGAKYEGYIQRQGRAKDEMRRLENSLIPRDTDYSLMKGLRLEAIEKLNRIRPVSIGQASRISGVTPADVNVLIVYLKLNKGV